MDIDDDNDCSEDNNNYNNDAQISPLQDLLQQQLTLWAFVELNQPFQNHLVFADLLLLEILVCMVLV